MTSEDIKHQLIIAAETIRLIRDGVTRKGLAGGRRGDRYGRGLGKREIILYQYRYTVSHHQNDSRIEMIGSNESHVNVSLIVRDKLSQDSVHRPH